MSRLNGEAQKRNKTEANYGISWNGDQGLGAGVAFFKLRKSKWAGLFCL